MCRGAIAGRWAALVLGLTLVLFALPASAQTAAPRTLVMSGQGEAKAVPDTVNLSAGVTSEAPTAAAALAANSRAMTGVFDALKRAGIADRQIQTSNFSVQPQYPPYNPNGAQPARRVTGYEVTNQVTVRLEDVSKLGATLDALVSSGANNLGGVGFSLRDPTPLADEARKEAVADAMAKAKTYAAAAGVTLGRILSISENAEQTPQPLFRAMAMQAPPSAPPPVAAGETSVTANVTITWEIQ